MNIFGFQELGDLLDIAVVDDKFGTGWIAIFACLGHISIVLLIKVGPNYFTSQHDHVVLRAVSECIYNRSSYATGSASDSNCDHGDNFPDETKTPIEYDATCVENMYCSHLPAGLAGLLGHDF